MSERIRGSYDYALYKSTIYRNDKTTNEGESADFAHFNPKIGCHEERNDGVYIFHLRKLLIYWTKVHQN